MADTDIGKYIWESRYRWSEVETLRDWSIAEMWDRVARATAEVEGTGPAGIRQGADHGKRHAQ